MSVSEYIINKITKLLDEYRVVVWYDGERAFQKALSVLKDPNLHIVQIEGSLLKTRRRAETIYKAISDPDAELNQKNASLLIYLPFYRSSGEDRVADPFEGFAVVGTVFGDEEAEQLHSLAVQALPVFQEEIHRLFREGKPTLELLDSLEHAPTYPLTEIVLKTTSPVEVAAKFIGDAKALDRILNTTGCLIEILRLFNDKLGFLARRGESDPEQIKKQFGRYILFSEFTLNREGDIPDALVALAPGENASKDRIHAVANQLRQMDIYRDTYLALASHTEQELKLEQQFAGLAVGENWETFPFEERQKLQELSRLLQNGEFVLARSLISQFSKSPWRYITEREQLWRVAEKCAELLEVAARVDNTWKDKSNTLSEMIAAYTSEQGWSDLDRSQRVLEQSLAQFSGQNELSDVITLCRSRYRQVFDAIQQTFLVRLQVEGWPPDGFLRQTQIYDRFIAPSLVNRDKVIFVMSDSLRFEMGRDLSRVLAGLGDVDLLAATSSLPTITSVGMAALLPGADGALNLRQQGDTLIPYLGETPMKDLNARMSFMRDRLGDLMAEIEISKFLSQTSNAQQEAMVGKSVLVILRDTRIDALGESVPLHEARRFMSEMIGDLKTAITQLIRLGYTRVVIAADHGHILLPEIKPGEVVSSPNGEWGMSKRRMRLGHQVKETPGSIVLNAHKVGIQSDMADFTLPTGFGVYSEGSGYMHGGVSLQEAVLPVITLRSTQQPGVQSVEKISILYSKKVFTSSVIGLKLIYNSLFSKQLRVKVGAYDGPGAKAKQIGEVAECEARDDVTHEVILTANQSTSVPILLDHDFQGDSIEIRVIDPDTQRVWERLPLKNEMLD